MKYIAEISQAGGGCDYTICCGTDVISLGEHKNILDAHIFLLDKIKEDYSHEERQLERATIYGIAEEKDINLVGIYEAIEHERDKKRKERFENADRKEYERLKKKFG